MTTKSIGIDDAANEGRVEGDAATSPSAMRSTLTRRTVLGTAAAATLASVGAAALPAGATTHRAARFRPARPLWQLAASRGITFGSSHSSRLFDDPDYCGLVDRQAGILFTEDDLLWYQLKPGPEAPLDFTYGDRLFARAKQDGQLVFAAHLVWDEGFGDGWGEDFSELWGLSTAEADQLLYGVERALLTRYRGRTAGWIVANEVTSPEGVNGLRTDVPWYEPLGPGYVAKAFRIARQYDKHATLVLNEFGFETTNEYDDDPVDRQQAVLQVIDKLRADHVPLDALGIQAHLLAGYFDSFDVKGYKRFLKAVADRGLKILVTEMDVLDDGLPADVEARDEAVGEIYGRYLTTVLSNPAVKAVMTFGLSDRYTWLQEDYPREDGAERRPLPYDDDLRRKPAYAALHHALQHAPRRKPLWRAPRQYAWR